MHTRGFLTMAFNHDWMNNAVQCAEERAFRIWDETVTGFMDDVPAEDQARARREQETSVILGFAPF